MIEKEDLIKHLKKHPDDFEYDEISNTVTRKSDNYIFTIDKLLEICKRKAGESFDLIYDFHAYCMSILKCTECGTIIRYFYDENYEHNFRCPTCTDYKTGYEYWSKNEIANSPELQNKIKMYEEMEIHDEEQYKRIKARGGLQDWELAKKTIHLKNIGFIFELNINDITNKNKLKGLRLQIHKLNKDGNGWVYGKQVTIPLSLSELYYHLIYKPYMKRNNINPLDKLKGKPLYETMEDCQDKALQMKMDKK